MKIWSLVFRVIALTDKRTKVKVMSPLYVRWLPSCVSWRRYHSVPKWPPVAVDFDLSTIYCEPARRGRRRSPDQRRRQPPLSIRPARSSAGPARWGASGGKTSNHTSPPLSLSLSLSLCLSLFLFYICILWQIVGCIELSYESEITCGYLIVGQCVSSSFQCFLTLLLRWQEWQTACKNLTRAILKGSSLAGNGPNLEWLLEK